MPSTELRKRIIDLAKTIVVKVGTNCLVDDDRKLSPSRISGLAEQVSELTHRGLNVVLVTSGAIGAGLAQAKIPVKPKALPDLQAVAAIGQPALMSLYQKAFARHGIHAAQILVTRADFESRHRYLNIRNTIDALHRYKAVPLINENDTVAVEEIRFGENDIIAAQMTNLLRADLLIILSVVEGLLDGDGKVVDFVPRIDDGVAGLVHTARSSMGTGGMTTKLQAVRLVTQAGEAAMIAGGRVKNILPKIMSGQKVGTLFAPVAKKMPSRDRWMGMTVRAAGRIRVDDGAANALRRGGKSLLATGIVGVEGEFERGDIVDVVDSKDARIARGKASYASAEVDRIKGCKTSQIEAILGEKPFDEVIHRDNLVLMAD